MKQVTTILLALLIFLQPFSKIWIVVSFKINQDNIAKTLCVKKEIKNNICQGKCHLKKQLDEVEKEEEERKQAPTNIKEKIEDLYCYNQISFGFLKQIVFPKSKSKILCKYKSDFYTSSFLTDIFRPPQLNLI